MPPSSPQNSDEWATIESLLPSGWEEQARLTGAFQRARYLPSASPLLRILLLHATGGSLRQTVTEAKAASIVSMSPAALHLRMKTSSEWLRWIAEGLCMNLRKDTPSFAGLRPLAVDSTTIQGPGNTTSEWRLHYSLDLFSLDCHWHELTDATGGESLKRTPVRKGDVLIADRNYLHAGAVRSVNAQGGYVLVRMRWRHAHLTDNEGRRVEVLSLARDARVSQPCEKEVCLPNSDGTPLAARIVVIKLPHPIAERSRKKLRQLTSKKQKKLDPRSLEAAGYVLLFTTVPAANLDTSAVAELYRARWQVELAFKRHKQILKLGRLPNKDPATAATWILAKLVVALLLETLYRNAVAFSPWGFHYASLPAQRGLPAE
jgi:hypothetical protein